MEYKQLPSPFPLPLFYCGPSLEEGPLPAFFYFALSGEESLALPPYNHPVLSLIGAPLRIFSFTLPFHGHGFDKFHAMEDWMSHLYKKDSFLEDFLQYTVKTIEWLISSQFVYPEHMGVGGLSRGGFIAAHVAAQVKQMRTLLAFAPVTRLQELVEFQPFKEDVSFSQYLDKWNLIALTDALLHLSHIRLYIGNRDLRVGTDACYQFIRQLAEKGHEKRARHCIIELFITHSLGYKGHGTASPTFEEGALWLKTILLG